MNPGQRLSDLTPARQALVRLFQSLNYGQILDLKVCDGEPFFDPLPTLLFDVKLDADSGCRPESDLTDFVLCEEVSRLFRRLDRVRDGRLERIEVRAGIPRRMLIAASFVEGSR